MVYCTKCGTKNEDDALDCISCKAPLKISGLEIRSQNREKSWEDNLERGAEDFGRRAEEFGKRMENECFGLPKGGAIFGLFIGIIIIIVGLQQIFRWRINIGPFVIIMFGLLVLAGAIYGLTRRKD
jgi:hypothetical protein